MNKTVKWLLLSLNFCDYQVVRIRVKGVRGIVDCGRVGKILDKYGSYEVLSSDIVENALIITIIDDNYTDCRLCLNFDYDMYGCCCAVVGHKYDMQHCPYYKKALCP